MSAFANSEDLDEMQHYAAFHQGLHSVTVCKGKKVIQKKNAYFFYFNLTSLDLTMDYPNLLYQTRRINPLVYKALNKSKENNNTFMLKHYAYLDS